MIISIYLLDSVELICSGECEIQLSLLFLLAVLLPVIPTAPEHLTATSQFFGGVIYAGHYQKPPICMFLYC